MLSDLAALTPPLIVAGVFAIGVVVFLRRQLGPAEPADDGRGTEITDDNGNADGTDHPCDPSADRRKV
jgi:hypothetical protein